MENKSLLSVCIITKNESRHIRECIKSVKFASEIIVVDSGSSDDTANIAAGLGVTVFENAFEDFASQKNYAVSKANHDWVLSLDADERVTDQLRKEIEFKIQNSACSAYRIKRTSYIFGKKFGYSGTQSDYPVRLFRKNEGRFKQKIHEFVEVKGELGTIESPITHYTFESIHDYLKRLNLYTSLEARQNQNPDRISGIKILIRSTARFVDIYCIKLGVLDKVEGFIFAVLSSWYECMKFFKITERNK